MGDDPVQNRLPGIQFIQRFGELAMGGNPHVLAPFLIISTIVVAGRVAAMLRQDIRDGAAALGISRQGKP